MSTEFESLESNPPLQGSRYDESTRQYFELLEQGIRERHGLGPDDPLPEPPSIEAIRKMVGEATGHRSASQLPRSLGRR